MQRSLTTPKKILKDKRLPYPVDIAFICFTPMPNYFKSKEHIQIKDRLFLHLHEMHTMICKVKYEDKMINVLVCAEVYGGPVAASIVEELAFYGVGIVIGVGFVGCLEEKPVGTNFRITSSSAELGTTPHYTSEKCVTNNNPVEYPFEEIKCWTTNAIYREPLEEVKHFRGEGCKVVNMDSSHLFAACKSLNMLVDYVCTVSDVLDEDCELDVLLNNSDEVISSDSGFLNSHDALIDQVMLKLPDYMKALNIESILERVRTSVSEFYYASGICKSHDINHIDRCCKMAKLIAYSDDTLTERTRLCVLLATILHDIDDDKFFKKDSVEKYSNARSILQSHDLCLEIQDDVVEMISYVSSSKNGDTIPRRAKTREYLLYPRYADRLDASGREGVIRCYQYIKTIGGELYLPSTIIPASRDVWEVATKERYEAYKGKSASMIDHYYDKLLRLCMFETANPVVLKLRQDKVQPFIEITHLFYEGKLTIEYMEKYIENST